VLGEGTDAPQFTLPGVVDGAIRQVDLSDYVGESIVVLAFYPADFNPAAKDDDCDLTELDLFTMQRDVEIFGIAPDSVYSHRAYADQYSLSIPLLSDSHGEVIEAYDVRRETENGLMAQRAVYVVDQRGVVQFTWETDDLEAHPDVDAVREAVSSIGGDSTAVGRYRVGHAHYIEGRRAFTSAMSSYEERDWLIAQGDFERAMEEFREAADQFQSSVRFAESDPLEEGFERAQEKSTSLWQAAEWLADSANAYASGDGVSAAEYREDAESPLESARDIGEPPDPDDFDLDRIADAQEAARATAASDDSPDLEAPTDPDEDETDSTPGGGEVAGSDDDIDAALEGVEVEGEGAEPSDDGTARDDPPDPTTTAESSDDDIDAIVGAVDLPDPSETTADGDDTDGPAGSGPSTESAAAGDPSAGETAPATDGHATAEEATVSETVDPEEGEPAGSDPGGQGSGDDAETAASPDDGGESATGDADDDEDIELDLRDPTE
jgi:peroxiredoxin